VLQVGKSTQVESLKIMQESGAIKTQHAKILEYLQVIGPGTAEAIADMLGMRSSSVTGRINELIELKLIKVKGRVFKESTRRTVNEYAVVGEPLVAA